MIEAFVVAWLMSIKACNGDACHTVYRRFPSEHACDVRSEHILMAVAVTDPAAWGFEKGPVHVTVKCAPVRASEVPA